MSGENQQLRILRDNLATAQRYQSVYGEQDIARSGYHQLQDIGIDQLWQQDKTTINQLLHKLFGKSRLVVVDKQVVGIKRMEK